MRIGVIAVPGAFDSTFTSVLDILGVAEELREAADPEIPPIENGCLSQTVRHRSQAIDRGR